MATTNPTPLHLTQLPTNLGNLPDDHDLFTNPDRAAPHFAACFHTVVLAGATYRLYDHGTGAVSAHRRTRHGTYFVVGRLTWFTGRPRYDHTTIDGGVIHSVHVSTRYRRKGVATALLHFARARYPHADVRHSTCLTADGKKWATTTP